MPRRRPRSCAREEAEREAASAVAELAARKHQHVEEARLTGEETDAAIRALRAQLRDAREQHERSAAEAEALLGEQEELSRRYRHEATELAQRSEGLVVELRSEASSERTRAVDAELRAARQELSRLRGAEAQHRATAHAWAYERKQLLRQADGPPRKSRKEDPHAAAVRQVEKAMARARVAQQQQQKRVPPQPRLQSQAVQQ
ncbi:hypothetical protein EMIHUDRAFT_235311 [Emiliania huxleyi CCMP1516]|uniref:Uncharacterized protein n=2 Tax=Emiliania huxleyi TaxID=2903 RepID=A0A0D3JWU8_EMIH1|nr:hypothetical protein EMIHUDRAFT_235311 [Emiliania huxleyi CCMP1516]EOD27983.1 hypothetical protein EMIHUDRAFT_235311 [Emiliania huxleyi CCMP1516]|eukprot:XP_005780412.1 hypothetical protein EMIHUDRAFT_235311 [Emiliania huxleyi CCMP1516]